jgi:hypothetical protein
MTEGQEHEWHIELDYMRAQMRHALDNLDNLSKRAEVQGMLEGVYFTLTELCILTKGESQ